MWTTVLELVNERQQLRLSILVAAVGFQEAGNVVNLTEEYHQLLEFLLEQIQDCEHA